MAEEKTLSIGAILSNAEKLKESTLKEKLIEIKLSRLEEVMGSGTVIAKALTLELLSAAIEKGANSGGRKFSYEGMDLDLDFLVANCIAQPDLGSKELMEGLGVKKKMDVIKIIFKDSELMEITKILTANMNGGVTLVEKIKN